MIEATTHATTMQFRAAHPAWSLERLFVASVPLAAGIATVSGPTIGGMQYTGFLWIGHLGLGTLLLVRNPDVARFPLRWITPFLVLVLASTLWGGIADVRQSQTVLQWAATITVGMIASMSVRNAVDLRRMFTCFRVGMAIALAAFVFFYYGPGVKWQDSAAGRGFSDRTAAITLALFAAVAIAHLGPSPRRSLLVVATCLGIAILTGSRMATAAMLLAPFANPLWRGWVTKSAYFGGIIVSLVFVMHTTAFQERFFFGEQRAVHDVVEGNINSSGRYELWPVLWKEAMERPVFGHGIATAGMYMDDQGFLLGHPHNEYLRVVFELGFVGLACFVVAVAFIGTDAWRRARAASGELSHAFAAVCMGMAVLLVMCATDNPLPYNVAFMHPLFLLIGAAYGAASASPSESRPRCTPGHASPDACPAERSCG